MKGVSSRDLRPPTLSPEKRRKDGARMFNTSSKPGCLRVVGGASENLIQYATKPQSTNSALHGVDSRLPACAGAVAERSSPAGDLSRVAGKEPGSRISLASDFEGAAIESRALRAPGIA